MRSLITNYWQKANLNIKIATVIVGVFVLWMVTGIFSSDDNQHKQRTKHVKTVAVRSFEGVPFTPKIQLMAKTESGNALTLSAEIKGRVIEKAEDGTFVKKGESILKLSIDTLEAQLAAAKAHLKEAEELYSAAQRLKKEGFKASTDLAAKKASLEDAKLALKAVEVDLGRINITAPTDGKVDEIMVDVGEYVIAGQELAIFVGDGDRQLVAHSPQKQRALIAPNTPVSADLVDGESVTGILESVAMEAADITKTYRVVARLDDTYQQVPLGMTARLYIPTEEITAYQVPHAALVLNSEGLLGVMTTKNNKAHFNAVNILEDGQTGLWVSGIAGEKADIVIRGQTSIIDQEIINPVQETIREN